jgi:hypothetical protein
MGGVFTEWEYWKSAQPRARVRPMVELLTREDDELSVDANRRKTMDLYMKERE